MAIDLEVLGKGIGRASEVFGGALFRGAEQKREEKEWRERLKMEMDERRKLADLTEKDQWELEQKKMAFKAHIDYFGGSQGFADFIKGGVASDNPMNKIRSYAALNLWQKMKRREKLVAKDYEAIGMFPPEVSIPMAGLAGELKQYYADFDLKVRGVEAQERLSTAQVGKIGVETEKIRKEVVSEEVLSPEKLLGLIKQTTAQIDKIMTEPYYVGIRGKLLAGGKVSGEEGGIYAVYEERLKPLMKDLARYEKQLREQHPDYLYEIEEPKEKEEEEEIPERKPFEFPAGSPLKLLEDTLLKSKNPLEAFGRIFGKKPKIKD